ncbi:MAG TPA: sodium:proton antiporter, partial [Rhodospirillaceae bacterium]|nr:sodium:proton antiporter [Rhodospirillaceae bacterium]
VIESDRTLTERLRKDGVRVIYGDASREAVLAAAHPQHARLMIVTVPDAYFAKQIVKAARKAQPGIEIVVRTHSDEEARTMNKLGVGLAVMGEREIAFGIIYHVLQSLGLDTDQTRNTIGQLRTTIYGTDRLG